MSAESKPLLRGLAVLSVIAVGAAIVAWNIPAAIHFSATRAGAGFWSAAAGALLVDIPLFGLSQREDLRPRITLSVCFTFAVLVLGGAAPAIVVQAIAGAVTAIGQRYGIESGLYLIARLVCATAVANVVLEAVSPGRRITAPGTTLGGRDLANFLLLSVVWLLISYGLLALAWAAITDRGLSRAILETRSNLATTAAAVLIVSPLLVSIDGGWKVFVVAPLVVLNQIFREQTRREQALSREPVSGMLNRQGLAFGMSNIADYDTVWRRGPRPFGIVSVNVESVLSINQMLGRDIGDDLIAEVTRRLVDVYGADRVGRLSDEAIVVLVPDLTEKDAEAKADEIVGLLTLPVEVNDVPFSLDPAAGVALSPQHGRDLGTLLAKADLAMAQARRSGRPVVRYVRHATEQTQRRFALVRELRAVLRDPQRWGEMSMLYQPQVQLETQRLAGVEALVRWRHPTWGAVRTDELIAAVEPTDVMHLLTLHVLDSVAAQMQEWNGQGRPLRVAVNMSVQDLRDPAFMAEFEALLGRYGIPMRQITVEITERMLITDEARVRQVATGLTRLGAGLSLDDFGTGHASLQQLRLLPLTEVKIDGAYVRGMVDNPADRALVTSAHQLARAQGLDVVAEGVEDGHTAAVLAELPGTIGQGWYFGAPMRPDELQRRAARGWQASEA